MIRALTIFGSVFFATYMVGLVVSTTLDDYRHRAGPCSVMDTRHCHDYGRMQ